MHSHWNRTHFIAFARRNEIPHLKSSYREARRHASVSVHVCAVRIDGDRNRCSAVSFRCTRWNCIRTRWWKIARIYLFFSPSLSLCVFFLYFVPNSSKVITIIFGNPKKWKTCAISEQRWPKRKKQRMPREKRKLIYRNIFFIYLLECNVVK